MATSTEQKNTSESRFESFIEERIAQTAQQVRWVDFFSFSLILTIGLLSALFVLCIVDAWIFELQSWMRWTAFALMIAGSISFLVIAMFPFLFRKINPLYAAQKIEEGRPELKNAVINYLTTQTDPNRRTEKAVRQKLSQTAAAHVSNIPLDVTVDRSSMIAAGYVLAGIVTLFAIYKFASPKDPFQTIGRVILPSSELMAPARVQISEIDPKDAQVYFGETIEISATIRGLGVGEFATLLMTTEDGRRVDFGLPMTSDANSKQYKVIVGKETGGLQQSFSYRIQAGDANTLAYSIDVRTCPTIFIESLNYNSPKYTEIPERLIENPTEISGVEGALVTIKARSNLPIAKAYLELFRETKKLSEESDSASKTNDGVYANPETEIKYVKKVLLETVDEKTASGEFRLTMNNRRTGPQFSHYRVSFLTPDGDKSQDMALSTISVINDLSPEIEIRLPKELEKEVPLDQVEKIEISAVDPDYRLTKIEIIADSRGNRLFNRLLLDSATADNGVAGVSGQQLMEFDFSPNEFGLQEGDEVIWYAIAEDNRTVGKDSMLDPNRTRTENFRFKIIAPLNTPKPSDSKNNPKEQKSGEQKSGEQKSGEQKSGEQKSGEQKSGEQKSGEQKSGEQKSGEQKSGEQKSGEQKSGEQKSGEQKSGEQKSGEQKSGEQKSGEQKSGEQKSGEQKSGEQKSGEQKSGEQKSGEQKSGEQKRDGGQRGRSQKNGSNNQKQSDEKKSSSASEGQKSDSDQQTGERSPNGNRDGKSRPDDAAPRDDSHLSEESGGENGNDNSFEQRQKGKPKNSKEAFERMKDYFDKKKKEQQNQDDKESSADPSEKEKQNAEKNPDPDSSNQSNGNDSATKDKPKSSGSESKDDPQESSGKSAGNEKKKRPDENSKGKNDSGTGKQDNEKNRESKNNQKSDGTKKGGAEEQGSKNSKSNPKTSGSEDKQKSNDAGKNSSTDQNDGKQQGAGKSGDKKSGDDPLAKDKASKDKTGGQKGSDSKKRGVSDKEGEDTGSKDVDRKEQNSQNGESKKQKASGKESTSKNGNKENSDGKKSQPSNSKTDSKSNGAENGPSDDRSKSKKSESGGDSGDVNSSESNQKSDARKKQNSSKKNQTAPKNDSKSEKANLKYAKETTDLVLEKLKDQKQNPDEDLLKDLNWTKEELQEFTKRWEQMQKKASSGSDRDKNAFQNALKSLGLEDPSNALQKPELKDDGKSGYKESSTGRSVPSDFQNQFRAIQKSKRKLKNSDSK